MEVKQGLIFLDKDQAETTYKALSAYLLHIGPDNPDYEKTRMLHKELKQIYKFQ